MSRLSTTLTHNFKCRLQQTLIVSTTFATASEEALNRCNVISNISQPSLIPLKDTSRIYPMVICNAQLLKIRIPYFCESLLVLSMFKSIQLTQEVLSCQCLPTMSTWECSFFRNSSCLFTFLTRVDHLRAGTKDALARVNKVHGRRSM